MNRRGFLGALIAAPVAAKAAPALVEGEPVKVVQTAISRTENEGITWTCRVESAEDRWLAITEDGVFWFDQDGRLLP